MRARTLITALVPVADNDGAPFNTVDFAAFEDALIGAAGGWTFDGERLGAWKDPESGIVYRDRTRAYQVLVDSDTAPTLADSIAALICTRFRQLAAFVTAQPISVSF